MAEVYKAQQTMDLGNNTLLEEGTQLSGEELRTRFHMPEYRLVNLLEAGKLELVELEEEYPQRVGGPYYDLSDGTRVRGKDKAYEQQEELDNG